MRAEISFPTFVEWVRDAVREQRHMGMAMEDALSCPPSTKALRYQRMKHMVITFE